MKIFLFLSILLLAIWPGYAEKIGSGPGHYVRCDALPPLPWACLVFVFASPAQAYEKIPKYRFSSISDTWTVTKKNPPFAIIAELHGDGSFLLGSGYTPQSAANASVVAGATVSCRIAHSDPGNGNLFIWRLFPKGESVALTVSGANFTGFSPSADESAYFDALAYACLK